MNSPTPVFARRSKLAKIAEKANVPAIVSPIDEPIFIDGPSGSPVTLINPAAAWTVASKAFLFAAGPVVP